MRLERHQIILAVVLIFVAALVWFATALGVGFSCAWDTSDCPATAAEGGVEWHEAEDAESSWQFKLLMGLPIAVVLTLLSALIGYRTRHAHRLFVAGAVLCAANLLAFAVLWF